jgi:hypothetical protein
MEGFGLSALKMMSRGKLSYFSAQQGHYRIKLWEDGFSCLSWVKISDSFYSKVGKRQFKSPKSYFGSYTCGWL